MPLDAIFLSALQKELSEAVCGAKISKVASIERDLVVLNLRAGEGLRLLISAVPGKARVHLTAEKHENMDSPTMFVMLLRKHLNGARIADITQPELERVLIFDLETYGEFGDQGRKRLVVEMIGRSPNIVLVGEDGRVIDCLRRVDVETSPDRPVLPGFFYKLPLAQKKKNLFAEPWEYITELFMAESGGKTADAWLLEHFSGLSPLICKEIAFRACGGTSPDIDRMDGSGKERFLGELMDFRDAVTAGRFSPTLFLRDGSPEEFSFMDVSSLHSRCTAETAAGFSELLEAFYTRREKNEMRARRAQSIQKSAATVRDRLDRKLSSLRQELLETAGREKFRRAGDLITANIYRIKKGDTLLAAEDFYSEDLETVEIALDGRKTPSQNAAKYYKAYSKAKNAETHLGRQIEKTERELDYLNSVLDSISRASSETEIAEIRRELESGGFLRRQSKEKGKKAADSGYMRFRSGEGFEILVGKNNTQNDRLTKNAQKSDIWLHVQKAHGSHVIVCCGGEKPDQETIDEAARLAAYFSQSSDSGKVAVDYTEARNVKKPNGALPGMVIYDNYKTIIVPSDGETVEMLRVAK